MRASSKTTPAIAALVVGGLLSVASGQAATGEGPMGFLPQRPATVEAAPTVLMAQASDVATLMLHIQDLEEQVRQLTGQVEGLTFQLTQTQMLLEGYNARILALEGGAAPATPAAPAPAPATGDQGALAVPDTGVQPLPGELEIDPTFDDTSASQDPLIGTAGQGQATLGTLDLTFDPNAPQRDPNAAAQFQAGYDAIVQGDFGTAQEQFAQFVALYPDDPQAADATNWLGEAMIQQGYYADAAEVLLTGYQSYPESPRAPELLLRLGIALVGAGETTTACRTFGEIPKRYPELSAPFQDRLREEEGKAQCPPPG